MNTAELFERIERLRASGVLGREECPEQEYWHWKIERVEGFPADLCDVAGVHIVGDEFRYYW